MSCRPRNKTALNKKVYKVEKVEDQKCSFCNKYFYNVVLLDEHIKLNHENAKECSYCFSKFPPWYFKEHVKHCSAKQVSILKGFDMENIDEKEEEQDQSSAAAVEERGYHCENCNQDFQNKNDMKQHMRSTCLKGN